MRVTAFSNSVVLGLEGCEMEWGWGWGWTYPRTAGQPAWWVVEEKVRLGVVRGRCEYYHGVIWLKAGREMILLG